MKFVMRLNRGKLSWRPYVLLLSAGFVVFLIMRAGLGQTVDKRPVDRQLPSGSVDLYGGTGVRVSEPTGFFSVKKFGDRWTFVTPEGNAFWMFGVYVVDWGDGGRVAKQTFDTKYGRDQFAFANHALLRLHSWGFNMVSAYSSRYAVTVPQYVDNHVVDERMPFLRVLNVSWYGAISQQPFKTLIAGGVDPEVYKNGWPGHTPDVFDPNFEMAARNMAGELLPRGARFTKNGHQGGLPHPSLSDEPLLIGTATDDSDYVFGMSGPGTEIPGVDGAIHPHLGWIVAVTRPTQTENTEVGKAFGTKRTVKYTDPTVYAKVAWREFLKKQYGTIQALNAAWGSSYTTFDSDGGWPMGRGLMDESGRGPWIGNDFYRLSSARPKVAADLDAFLGVFADRYYEVVTGAIRAATPHHLVFSQLAMNSHKGLTRRQILRAAGRYCDVIEMGFSPERPEPVGITYSETGRPITIYYSITANTDSALYEYPRKTGPISVETQSERAARYKKTVEEAFSYLAGDGSHPIVGLDWWEYMDKLGERSNFGLVSPLDNAYDGKEAVRASGKDAWGYPTGGEDRDYGDFLTTVRQTNFSVRDSLRDEISRRKTAVAK